MPEATATRWFQAASKITSVRQWDRLRCGCGYLGLRPCHPMRMSRLVLLLSSLYSAAVVSFYFESKKETISKLHSNSKSTTNQFSRSQSIAQLFWFGKPTSLLGLVTFLSCWQAWDFIETWQEQEAMLSRVCVFSSNPSGFKAQRSKASSKRSLLQKLRRQNLDWKNISPAMEQTSGPKTSAATNVAPCFLEPPNCQKATEVAAA